MILDKKISLEYLRKDKTRIISELKSKSRNDNEWDEMNALLDIESKSKYLFSKSVSDSLHTIKIKDEFDCNILRNRKTINGIILLNTNELYIFNTIGENLRVLYLKTDLKNDFADILIFTFKIYTNKKIIDISIESDIWKRFLQSIIYLDFLPTEIKYINPKEKIGQTRKDKIINKLNEKFILVTKAWNQSYKTLPNTKYLSKAHWGIRWTGKGRTIPIMTFIKASLKEMNKKPEKESKR